ncbi:hypothetical protein ACWEP4_41875 [Streptomyces sp. NPDC004227]
MFLTVAEVASVMGHRVGIATTTFQPDLEPRRMAGEQHPQRLLVTLGNRAQQRRVLGAGWRAHHLHTLSVACRRTNGQREGNKMWAVTPDPPRESGQIRPFDGCRPHTTANCVGAGRISVNGHAVRF